MLLDITSRGFSPETGFLTQYFLYNSILSEYFSSSRRGFFMSNKLFNLSIPVHVLSFVGARTVLPIPISGSMPGGIETRDGPIPLDLWAINGTKHVPNKLEWISFKRERDVRGFKKE